MADNDAVKREPFPIPLLDELDQPYSNFGNLGPMFCCGWDIETRLITSDVSPDFPIVHRLSFTPMLASICHAPPAEAYVAYDETAVEEIDQLRYDPRTAIGAGSSAQAADIMAIADLIFSNVPDELCPAKFRTGSDPVDLLPKSVPSATGPQVALANQLVEAMWCVLIATAVGWHARLLYRHLRVGIEVRFIAERMAESMDPPTPFDDRLPGDDSIPHLIDITWTIRDNVCSLDTKHSVAYATSGDRQIADREDIDDVLDLMTRMPHHLLVQQYSIDAVDHHEP